jgi:solute carrier family 50 protein (sugar transporter)
MANDDLGSTIFGWVGNALALYFYIAPIVPFVKVIKGEMTWKQSPGVLLLCSFLNCILWSDYGLITNQFLLYLANGLGGTITLIYITIFLIHVADRKVLLSLFYNFFLICCIVEIYFVFYYLVPFKVTGIIANIFNVLMYAAPGEKIYQICKGASYQLIPIWSTIGGTAGSAMWMCYGIAQVDYFVIVPNALGVLASIVQIVIFVIYRRKQKNKAQSEETTKE